VSTLKISIHFPLAKRRTKISPSTWEAAIIDMVRTGTIDPTEILTQQEPLTSAIDAYKAFDERQPGWIKVELKPRTLAA
jgi:threonine dehydrogenase-like Zn-dependent dehydrogenase